MIPRTRSDAGAASIDEVVDRLDAIVDHARRERSRTGYFAALYREVTARVRDGIGTGRFEDPERVERLDVVFANRYLDAYEAWRAGRPATRSWSVAFDTVPAWRPLILQHLLLGINAHINLDLGIAAAQTAPVARLGALRHDFDEISRLLAEMLDDVQDRIARVSPWMWLIDRIGFRTDEEVCNFCIGRSRDIAWRTAERFAALPAGAWNDEISRVDRVVAALATPIRNPGFHISAALLCVRTRENGSVPAVIDALRG